MLFALPKARLVSAALLVTAALLAACGGASERLSSGAPGSGDEGAVEPDTCTSLEGDYALALEVARACTPTASNDECTAQWDDGVACGCPTFVNPGNSAALGRALAAATGFGNRSCRAGNVCGPCQVPTRGHCSATGRCEDVYGSGQAGRPWPG